MTTTLISVEECRRILSKSDMTDAEIKQVRDALCGIADIVLDDYFSKLQKAT